MRTHEDNLSPYLRRPIRTYEQVLREQTKSAGGANRRSASPSGPSPRSMPRREKDDVEPGR